MSSMCNPKLKIVVVGDGGVGKSVLTAKLATINRPDGADFPDSYKPSRCFEYTEYELPVKSRKTNVSLRLVTVTGQEDQERLRMATYNLNNLEDANVVLLCFPAADSAQYEVGWQEALENVMNKWIPEVQHFFPNASIVFVGTKADTRLLYPPAFNGKHKAPVELVHNLVKSTRQAIKYVEISTKKWEKADCLAFFTDVAEVALDNKARRDKGKGMTMSCLVQ